MAEMKLESIPPWETLAENMQRCVQNLMPVQRYPLEPWESPENLKKVWEALATKGLASVGASTHPSGTVVVSRSRDARVGLKMVPLEFHFRQVFLSEPYDVEKTAQELAAFVDAEVVVDLARSCREQNRVMKLDPSSFAYGARNASREVYKARTPGGVLKLGANVAVTGSAEMSDKLLEVLPDLDVSVCAELSDHQALLGYREELSGRYGYHYRLFWAPYFVDPGQDEAYLVRYGKVLTDPGFFYMVELCS